MDDYVDPTEPSLDERQSLFLEAIENHGYTDQDAAILAGVSRWTVWRWKKQGPFSERYKAARCIRLDQLIQEAERRAMHGSDRMLEFLLCNYAPEKFSNKQKVEHSGDIGIAERLARGRQRAAQREDDGSDLAG